VGTEAVTAALELGRRLGARTVLNAAPAPQPGSLDLNALLAATDVLVVNETEAELMAGERGEGEGGWAGPAARLLGLGCRSVVITLGAAGAVVAQADRPGIVAVPAPQVPYTVSCVSISVADPDQEPDPDTYVSGPSGSGSA
jgi:ribokinase